MNDTGTITSWKHLRSRFCGWLLAGTALFVLVLDAPVQANVGGASSAVSLTADERAFLAANFPIVFVSQTNYPPFEFVDEVGDRRGMMIELARWISTELGFHAEFTDTTFQEAQEAVLDGKAHVLTSFFYSEARDQLFDFTRTVFLVPASIFVSAARPDISALQDLNGRRIAIQRGDYAKTFLESRNIEFTPVPTADFASAAQAVIDGEADAMIGDEQIVLYYLYRNQLNEHMKIVGEPLYTGRNAMAVRDGNLLLRSILDKGIAHAQETGTLDRLTSKWIGTPLPTPRSELSAYWPYAAAVLFLLIWTSIWNLRLRQIVRRRTAQLWSNERRLKDILQGTQAGTWEFDLQSRTYDISDFWAGMLGYTVDELRPLSEKTRKALLHPDDEHQARGLLERHVAGELEHYSCEIRMKHKHGHWVWVLDRGQVSRRNRAEKPVSVSGTSIDISKSKQREQELQLAASVFGNAREGITIADASGQILEVNEAFSRITGYTREEAIGSNPRILSSGRHDKAFYVQMWQKLLEEDAWEGEVWNKRKTGEIYPEMLRISTVRNSQGAISHFVAVFSDISRQKQHERQLEHIAFHDSLTGLPNRSLLTDRLKQAMTRARRSGDHVVLAYIDLDGFKEINDFYGHDAGDRVLKSIAKRLTGVLREEDTVARFGGDEFVVVLSERTCSESLEALINRLISRIAEPIELMPGQSEEVSGSIGIVVHDANFTIEPDQLIRQADQAMYQAKQAGKNRYHIFDAAQEQAIRHHHEKLERIREALDKEELELYYQPKVNMHAGTVIGVEALIRWRHPDRGIVPPAEFLPCIQNHHLAIEIGHWVIARALSQCAEWRRAGLQLPVSVNIDAVHLQQRDFVETLQAELSRHPELGPGDLELEILETNALGDVNNVSKTMRACQRIGVSFALDDFGTGYSSLTYLRRLPAHLLKLDRTFVRDMLEDPEDLTILEAVIGLAKAFRRDVIAEGIETIEHGSVLLSMGCQLGQGYAIAHPMPADELSRWLAEWQPEPSWQGRLPLEADELPVIHAIVDQRACAKALLGYLKNERAEPPQLNCDKCRFGLWLQRGLGRKVDPLMSEIVRLHRDYEALGKRLIDIKRGGEPSTRMDRIEELESVRDRLLEMLELRIAMRTAN